MHLLARCAFSRAEPFFYAFDIPWLGGDNLRDRPLIERKSTLRRLIGRQPSRLLYSGHLAEDGSRLFEKICSMDLEGIVAKPACSSYHLFRNRPAWMKIENPMYSQAEGRHELFEPRVAQTEPNSFFIASKAYC